jgi:hypothetical protein
LFFYFIFIPRLAVEGVVHGEVYCPNSGDIELIKCLDGERTGKIGAKRVKSGNLSKSRGKKKKIN